MGRRLGRNTEYRFPRATPQAKDLMLCVASGPCAASQPDKLFLLGNE